ncbi:nucleotide sugar dehydrogenase [Janthinobacterium sp. 17J80-10]|uniref:nucleotide sugar dehydrogenase n=1 Tax=Janthinobacterium sp. 17J80-10 TaxID=2497863 RepID=UPI0010055158|nr:nucleotide sugar dehydrogenase [Janthinobacterium sp. 17J80-10]QAU33627.1 nucleotide sugar dehydrogenase [Janthinobacterium sp. 17J80-10]
MNVIAVVGLGYVGLPLAAAFGKRQPTIGYDLSAEKIRHCENHRDPSGTVTQDELRAASKLKFTTDAAALAEADFIIIAVPTPIDAARHPDFSPLISASRDVGRHMKRGATVIFESTVYPGATEEVCIPVLEQASGKKWKADFQVGYSPERINPGDKNHTLVNTIKVVAGDSPECLEQVAQLYESVVSAGVHRVSSLRVAEAAKVIENTQRDLNIALMNELAVIFNMLGLDTLEVLEAAGTKWNFLPFRPGLVGGHCIGVDPYYLTYKAEMAGYHPEVILAGRRINDGMGKFIAEQTVKQMIQAGSQIKGARVNVLGITFKENVPDLRSSKVIDLIRELESYGIEVLVHDPVADAEEAHREYGVRLSAWEDLPRAEALVVAVAHRQFMELPMEDYSAKVVDGGCLIDVKAKFDAATLREAGLRVWRL